MRIAICIPNRDDFKGEVVSTVARLTWDICGAGHQPMYLSSHSCFIDKARNMLWDVVKQSEADYMLFLDSDVAVATDYSVNVIQQLIDAQKDVVVGLYVDKRPPHRLHIYDFTADGLLMNKPDWPKDQLFKIDAGPTGFMFISKKVMDAFTPEVEARLGRPFAYLDYGKPTELGEDVSFCKRLQKLGFEVWADSRLTLAHYGKEAYTTEHYEYMKKLAASQHENGIEGWMSPLELEFLGVMGGKQKSIVEVGSWKGRSTKALLETGKKVFAVDTWEGSQDPNDLTFSQAKQEDIFATFQKNVGHYENLKVIKKDSLSAAKQFSDKSVDMVFIDANHTYEGVKADIEAWLPKAKRVICGHDYTPGWPGVVRAVDELFAGRKVQVVGSIWCMEL
jgi:predicted O-methyltransferase YrrM